MNNTYLWNQEVQILNGYNRVCIYDLPRNDYTLAPKEIEKLINKVNGKNDKQLKLSEDERDWLNLFIEKEYFLKISKNTFQYFNKIEYNWKSSSYIFIAEIHDTINIFNTLSFLEKMLCKYVIINIDDNKRMKFLLEQLTLNSTLNKVCFRTKKKIGKNKLIEFKKKYSIFDDVFIHEPKIKEQKYFDPFFKLNIATFTESQENNLYYNRRIYINEEGVIGIDRNKMTQINFTVVENLRNHEIDEKLKSELDFYWRATKNNIEICKDCEFRAMCIDNRIPAKRDEADYYYLTECNYNPFISKWKNEENYQKLSDVGVCNGKNGLKIDNVKLQKINEKIW